MSAFFLQLGMPHGKKCVSVDLDSMTKDIDKTAKLIKATSDKINGITARTP